MNITLFKQRNKLENLTSNFVRKKVMPRNSSIAFRVAATITASTKSSDHTIWGTRALRRTLRSQVRKQPLYFISFCVDFV